MKKIRANTRLEDAHRSWLNNPEAHMANKVRANFLLTPATMKTLKALSQRTGRTMTDIVEDGIALAISADAVAHVEHLGDVPDTRFLETLPHRERK